MRWCPVPLLLLATALGTASPVPFSVFQHAVEERLGTSDRWAFTQRVRESDQGRHRERLERYDPSQPLERRWTLLAVDGRTPTAEQQGEWARWKARRIGPQTAPAPLDYLDLDQARRLEDDGHHASWEVPLRSSHRWLFPVEKIRVRVTIDLATGTLERLTAEVREPFRVLLGLARITDGILDLSFPEPAVGGPANPVGPQGSAQVSLTRLGGQAEFSWSDFTPVGPPRR